MWKLFRMVQRHKDLVPDMIKLIELIQASGEDGHLSKKERGQLISEFSRFIKKVGPGSRPRGSR